MGTQDKPKVAFSFRSPRGTGKRRAYKSLAEGLRQIVKSAEMRPYINKAHEEGRDELVGVFCSGEGRPLLVVVAAAPTKLVPEDESSLPGGWNGDASHDPRD